jgi:malonate-semialdehyde dehydrogenase (acetylating)/methylmalonate-semialdehyde dehydrogenase
VRAAARRRQPRPGRAAEAVEAICDHPDIRAVSFVGSTPVARAVYRRATHAGKRVQALGGAKNFIVVMPDADMDRATRRHRRVVLRLRGASGASRGASWSRWARPTPRLATVSPRRARAMRVGDGSEEGVAMGPVISAAHRDRVLGYIDKGVSEGARLVLDGRPRSRGGNSSRGFFLGPTVFDGVRPEMTIAPRRDLRGRSRRSLRREASRRRSP